LVLLDRTLLMLFYRFVGRRVVFTAHNVNAGKRDGRDTLLNRLSLRIQYRLVHHIFVHTEKMKAELEADFQVPRGKVTVIPLGLNETVPVTRLTAAEAKQKLGIAPGQKTILFFGRITPYKGLDYLIEAMSQLVTQDPACRLIIAGEIKHSNAYWPQLQALIEKKAVRPWLIERIQFIPDEETELYFKAADVLALPYTDVFQSGVLILGYSFGLPVIATDVGSLREDVIEGKTGFVCRPRDATDLARAIRGYFDSELFLRQEAARDHIRAYAKNRFSWSAVAATTERVYAGLVNE
jgi:glycosyltransferase involved in cell wall biosynthesis